MSAGSASGPEDRDDPVTEMFQASLSAMVRWPERSKSPTVKWYVPAVAGAVPVPAHAPAPREASPRVTGAAPPGPEDRYSSTLPARPRTWTRAWMVAPPATLAGVTEAEVT